MKHRAKAQSVSLADKECAIIVEYLQEDFIALPDGTCGEQQGTTVKFKKVKVKPERLEDVDELLEELLGKSKWMKSISEAIQSKLIELQQREAQASSLSS